MNDEHRKSPIRRQFNEAFCSPDGTVSISKVLAVVTQVGVLNHFMLGFDKVVANPESLLVILTFLIAPDVIKKAIAMKYGATNGK